MDNFFDHIRKGELSAVERLLDRHPELVRVQDSRGSTPLILAAYYNQGDIVDALLKKGADVNAKDGSGSTALMGACFKGYDEVARKLIRAGADINTRNVMGASCLIFAITFKREEIAKLLISEGADTSARDARGHTAVDHARMQGLHSLVNLLEK